MATLRQFVRNFQTTAQRFSLMSHDPKEYEGAIKLWRNLTFFVAFPAIALCMVNAYLSEKEHMEHFERPEWVPYPFRQIRHKRFPWGDGKHSLFFNPKVNVTEDGYDD